MPILTLVDADPDSCRACADGLSKLAEATEDNAQKVRDAKAKSEHGDWEGIAGDKFREKIEKIAHLGFDFKLQLESAKTGLSKFADDMSGVKATMNRAVAVALEAGLQAGPDVCNATWIMDPPDPGFGPYSVAQETKMAKQLAAYAEANQTVAGARQAELDAHSALQKSLNTVSVTVDSNMKDLAAEAPWVAASAPASYVEAAVKQADKWEDVAQTRAASLDRYAKLAQEYGVDATKQQSAWGQGVAAAEKNAASNARLILGNTDSVWARGAAADAGSFFTNKGAVSTIAKKVPLAGGLVAAAQMGTDIYQAGSVADAGKAVAKDGGSFIAGTAATTWLLASAAGGPATVAAVGAGIVVGYGVGQLIKWTMD